MKTQIIENNAKNIVCEYKKRKVSKNIKIRIDDSGVVKISLPTYIPYFIAEKFVKKNLNWIEEKLNILSLRKNKYYYLGNNIRLINKFNTNHKNFNYISDENILIVEYPNNSLSNDELFFKWLREKAEEYIPNRVSFLSNKYNFHYNLVRIKNLKSRWGSCSIKRNLSFNYKLMFFDYKVIDYVIIHELCHLKEMNHSKKFWDHVKEIMPEYKTYKIQLNKFFYS